MLNAATVFEYRNWPENEDLETYGDSEVKEVYLHFKKRLDKGWEHEGDYNAMAGNQEVHQKAGNQEVHQKAVW